MSLFFVTFCTIGGIKFIFFMKWNRLTVLLVLIHLINYINCWNDKTILDDSVNHIYERNMNKRVY